MGGMGFGKRAYDFYGPGFTYYRIRIFKQTILLFLEQQLLLARYLFLALKILGPICILQRSTSGMYASLGEVRVIFK